MQNLEDIKRLIDLIDESIKEDADLNITGGNIISDGYNSKVDEFRSIILTSKDWLNTYIKELCESSSISNLKIKYTSASGYFIEIPKSQTSKVPENFIHKQTLVNASRYITIELKEFEEKLLEAENSLASLEYDIFLEIRLQILDKFKEVKAIGDKASKIDFISSLAEVANQNNYSKPSISKNYDLKISGGRHPVIETIESDFISNSLSLNKKDFVHIITGPNMGGKSTFLRQNALIVLMAHMGSYVPANSAQIPLSDRVFSRVGASDNLYQGQSTFMVEMQEVANILNNSTKNSFVIIDEVGRGTSTYDGMSLAWSILKHNHDKIKAKTLFATHYHELIDESKKLNGVKNFSVAVGENDENLIFLRKIVPGGIKKSFGLEVAKIAGLSPELITEARRMLKKLELEHDKGSQLTIGEIDIEPEIKYIEKKSKLEEELQNLDLNSMSPIDALNWLSKMKK